MGLVRTSGPASEPVTTSEAKTHLRVTSSSDDTYIGSAITAARELCENYTGRCFINQTFQWTLDCFPLSDWEYLIFPRAPLGSVTSVTYYDSNNALQTWSSAEYDVDTAGNLGRLRPKEGYSWPSTYDRPNAVTVTFVSGYGSAASSVPQSIKQAMLFHIADIYDHRATQVTGTSVSAMPFGAANFLAAHVIHWP